MPCHPNPTGNQRARSDGSSPGLGLALPIIGENLCNPRRRHRYPAGCPSWHAAVAGVGTAVEFVYFIISILIALEIGATVLVSQAFEPGCPPAYAMLPGKRWFGRAALDPRFDCRYLLAPGSSGSLARNRS